MYSEVMEAVKVVQRKIQELEPQNGPEIFSYIVQHYQPNEIINLALSNDHKFLEGIISRVKSDLATSVLRSSYIADINRVNSDLATTSVPRSSYVTGKIPALEMPLQFTPFSPASSRPFLSPTTLPSVSAYWDVQQSMPNMEYVPPYAELFHDDYRIANSQYIAMEDQLDQGEYANDHMYMDRGFGEHRPVRASRRSPSMPDFPIRPCSFHAKGYCKHGNNCRFLHDNSMHSNFSMFSASQSESTSEDYNIERLDFEVSQLLQARRQPISIASLPQLYFERYSRHLRGEGYLTESQRHGKTGHSLSKLLSRLTSVRVIDKPHGQHSVVLAEDAHKFHDNQSERNDSGGSVPASKQIYLTFPAESIFKEEDVANYFSKYGTVEDVRIPSQQKRMFGFVTFSSADTVKYIHSKSNPHFVCGARVLVKQYKDKQRTGDRKYQERFDSHLQYNPSHRLDVDTNFHPAAGMCETSSRLRQRVMDEHEQILEYERKRLQESHVISESQFDRYFSNNQVGFGQEQLTYLLDMVNISSETNNNGELYSNDYDEHEQESNQVLNLPESPFASPINKSSISTAI